MFKFHIVLITLLFTLSSGVSYADSYICESPSSLHQKKMNKYKMPTFPQLLKDCGLDGLLGSFGLDNVFKLPDIGLLCGYTTSDIAGWYGMDTSVNVGGQVKVDLNVVEEANKMFGNEPLFEMSK